MTSIMNASQLIKILPFVLLGLLANIRAHAPKVKNDSIANFKVSIKDTRNIAITQTVTALPAHIWVRN